MLDKEKIVRIYIPISEIKMYIFIDKECLLKPFSYETCCCLSAIK